MELSDGSGVEQTGQGRPAPTQLDLLQGIASDADQQTISPSAPADQPSQESPAQKVVQQPHGIPATLLILDTETTGLDPDQDHCLEVGAILFDVASRRVLQQLSFLLPVSRNAAEAINRIPAEITQRAQPWQQAVTMFGTLVDASDVVVAHNAAFDKQWFGRGVLPVIEKPWLCTMEDIRWPEDRQLRPRPSVRDLALAYGIPVWAAHRALTDCIYIADVFQRCDDLETLLKHGLEPRQLMRAHVSYSDRQLAKQAGFRWNDPVPGSWSRRLSDREAADLPFRVSAVEDDEAALASA